MGGMCFQLTLQKLSIVNILFFTTIPVGTNIWWELWRLLLSWSYDRSWSKYPSFPHEDLPIYYDASHQQLKDEELLIYDDLDLTISDSWTLERDTRAQANSLIWMEQQKNRVTASKFYDVYSWKRGMEKHADNFVAGTPTPSAFLQRRFDHGRMYEPIAWKTMKYTMRTLLSLRKI